MKSPRSVQVEPEIAAHSVPAGKLQILRHTFEAPVLMHDRPATHSPIASPHV